MTKVVIESKDTLAGSYDIDLSYFTNRELHIIKKESGLRMGEFQDAIEAGDSDFLVALALVALRRNGRELRDSEALWDLEAGKITIDATEDEASPPELAEESDESSSPSSSASSANGESSPETSPPSSSGPPG